MSKKTILLVDDDSDDRLLFDQILKDVYQTSDMLGSVENGLEMINFLNEKPDDRLPDLIILDQNMPKMTGKESLVFLKKHDRYKHIPVIIYSTYQAKDFFQECLQLGALDVVSKPDSFSAYRSMVEGFYESLNRGKRS